MDNLEIKNYISNSFDKAVRDPLWKNIYLNRDFLKLCDTRAFQNLSEIKQLGPTYLIYPGAVHSRANHSFGVFEIGKRIISKLLADPFCPKLSKEGVNAFLAACLFHDTGHFPYTHSLKELPLMEHEAISQQIVNEEDVASILENDIGTSADMVGKIINTEDFSDDKEINFYRNILSGVLDPDKLDYLNRDAFFCGVPYGIQDTDFIIDKLTANRFSGVGIYKEGLLSVENILFSKYSMYKSVYWHQQVRCATAMIKKAIITALNHNLIKDNELYHLNDTQFFSKYTDENFLLSEVFSGVRNRRFYTCIYETEVFDEQLLNLKYREEVEAKIVKKFLKSDEITDFVKVIIDVPEPIKFESNLTIFDKDHCEIEGKSIFNKNISDRFSENLRKLRVFVEKGVASKIELKDISLWIKK